MVPRRLFGAALLASPVAMLAQNSSPESRNKAALIQTLRSIEREARRIQNEGNPFEASVRWLTAMAGSWTPQTPDEGVPLLVSVDRALDVLKQQPSTDILNLIAEDLAEKVEHCRAKGLATLQRVNVITKRAGLDEVKGLEVLYIEKFLQSDTTVKPYVFRRFSSPAVEDLAPGRYVFWAKDPAENGRSGRRKEARVGNGHPAEPIEVLAP